MTLVILRLRSDDFLDIDNVPGAKVFEDLLKRSGTGVVYNTFRDAALALQLLEDDNEWRL
ncbi:hypothetical protein BGX26_007303, partial [Mortierella sp. AD094]